jgi:hypothetical protein
MKFRWNRTMLNLWGIVPAILKMATGRNFSMSGINSGHHYLPTYQILMTSDNVEFLPPIFYAMFWQPFWKFWKRRIAPLMVTYHYVKFYVSIIIHLEVININVRNFNFPIGFYSNPLWTPQNMTLTPFTTKLKTLGPTRNIYLNCMIILQIETCKNPITNTSGIQLKGIKIVTHRGTGKTNYYGEVLGNCKCKKYLVILNCFHLK